MADNQVDVLVIGGGIAGLTAANRAAELGKKVIVLEKGADDPYKCNSRYTGGTFHISYTSVLAGEDKLYAVIEKMTAGFARKDLARAVAKDSSRLVRWLQAEGVKFVNLGQYHTFVLAPPSRTGPGLDWEGRGGDVMLRTLGANLEKRGGKILRGTRARTLDVSKSPIEVGADQGGASIVLQALAVIIADGGFQADMELIRSTITPAADRLVQRNAGTGTGDGLRMAQAAGAATVEATTSGVGCFYGHLLSRDAMTNDRLWPRPYVDALAAAAIMVDGEGRRFADEGEGGVFLANAVARLADPLSASLIFDQALWDGPGANPMVPANPHLPKVGGTLHQANTLGELAAKIGVSGPRLQEVVGQYNAALASNTLQTLSPPRRIDKYKPWPIKKAPFYALPLSSGITNTMGGIAVDQDGAVLDRNDKPIPGLFAAGATIGGLEGGPAIGYVGGLVKATLGLRAAEKIANFAP